MDLSSFPQYIYYCQYILIDTSLEWTLKFSGLAKEKQRIKYSRKSTAFALKSELYVYVNNSIFHKFSTMYQITINTTKWKFFFKMLFHQQQGANCCYDNVGSGKIFDLFVLFRKISPFLFLLLEHPQFQFTQNQQVITYYIYKYIYTSLIYITI